MAKANTRDGDPYVYNAQEWLNNTFRGMKGYEEVPENGKTGWATIYGFIRAFQICLGIENPADNFGPSTEAAFRKNFPNGIEEQLDPDTVPQHGFDNQLSTETMYNIYGIIQGSLSCKGYDYGAGGQITCRFLSGVGNAIKKLKLDAGISDTTSVVTLNIMKALLSMDYFTSYNTSERTKNIINMQRYLNRYYEDYIGLRPCDGVYGRRTNQALIYAIQAEEEMPISVANGNCGPATQKSLPNIPYNGSYQMNGQTYGLNYNGEQYSSENIIRFRNLANIALYFNGFGSGEIEVDLKSEVITEFQKQYAIPETGIIDFNTWLSLLISCGNVNRPAIACDCITHINSENVTALTKNGYKYIGRYLSNVPGGLDKAMTLEEIKIIFKNNIRLFPIHQRAANNIEYFTTNNGALDGEYGVEYTEKLYLQFGVIVYFAIDFDATDQQITDYILPYFKSLYSTFITRSGGKYRVGVYGTRNVCTKVCDAGYACSSFVSDMSTGFSGNLGFIIPENWAFDQFATTTISANNESIEIDKDGFSGRYQGISQEYSDLPYENLNTNQNSFIIINRAGSSIPVYDSKKATDTSAGLRYIVDGNIIGEIKENDFYIFFGLANPGISDHIHKVMYNDGLDVKVGYIEGGPGILSSNVYEENYAQIPKYQELFSRVNYDPSNNTYIFHPITSSGYDPMIFTINKPVPYFNGINYQGMLYPGDKIKINGNNQVNPGASRPWNMFVDEVRRLGSSEDYEEFNCFVSVGLEYASAGKERAWY